MGNWRPRTAAEYWAILQGRKWLVLLYATGVAFAALTLAQSVPNQYESRAVLVIAERAGKDPQARSSRIATARQRVVSTANLEALVNRHDLKRTNESVDAAVQRLRKEIKIETKVSDEYPPIPEALYVSYHRADPKLAQQVVTEVVANLNLTNDMLNKRWTREADWLGSQIKQLEKQLTDLGRRTASVVLPTGLTGDPEAVRMALLSTIDSLGDKQYALQQQITEQERQIREQRRIAASSAKDSPSGALLLRKTELAAQLRTYAGQYTEKNPKVLQAKTELSEIDRQLSALKENNPASATYETLGLERDLVRMQTEVDLARRETGRRKAELEMLYQVHPSAKNPYRLRVEAAAGYDRFGKRYQTLLEQRDEIEKMGISESLEPALFQVIDAPTLPQQPVGPNRVKLGVISVALGLGAGLLILVITEGRRLFFLRDQDDVAYFLGVPVLTIIPETFSPTDRAVRWRRMLASRFGVFFLAAAIPALALAIRNTSFFQSVMPR